MKYDVIIIGSGAGGAAAAYHLTQTGKQVLVVEKGMPLPHDGSTLDVGAVMRRGAFLSTERWVDRRGELIVPEEHFNVGGKTKWYGAALLRFAPHEFDADSERQFLSWPIRYDELAPFYDEAEQLLGVRTFAPEPALQRLVGALHGFDQRWSKQTLMVGLDRNILDYPEEAGHFDGFASVRGLKSDAETCLLDRVRDKRNLHILTGNGVRALLPSVSGPLRVAGVECEDGTRYHADAVLLAAGALHSPRLLQSYLDRSGLEAELPAARSVGRNYKFHVLTALLAFSHRPMNDVLSKTLLLTHEAFPHSTVQTLGRQSHARHRADAGAGVRAAGAWYARSPHARSGCSCRPKMARTAITACWSAAAGRPVHRSTMMRGGSRLRRRNIGSSSGCCAASSCKSAICR
jgi:hypothetical protein